MSEAVVEEVKQEVISPVNPFSNEGWKATPTAVEEVKDPAIKEKDENIKIEKPVSDKPNEPEKIPGASPKPVQDRPADTKKPEGEAQIFDEAVYLKDNFGVESIDDVKKELAELRAKATTPAEIKYANEESKKVFDLIKEGKTDEVLAVLSEQKRLKEVDKLAPADIIKLNLQYRNKDFSPDEINDLFSETYAIPEKPKQELESDEEFADKLAKYEKEVQKVEARIKRDAKPATTELLKLQKEIVLPDIPTQKAQEVVKEPTQEELDAQKKLTELFFQSVDDGVKNFKGYESTFKDEEVEIKVAYVPSEEERKQYQPLIALSGVDGGKFLQEIGWIDDKGNINVAKLTEDLPFILNKGKVIDAMVTDAGTERHKASVKAIKNIDYSGKQKSNGELGATPQELQGKLATHFFSQ